MHTYQLIYGTYSQKEWDGITAIFAAHGVDYTEAVHIHSHGTNDNRDTWYFYSLKAYVTKEQQALIQQERNRLKKRHG